MSSIPLQKQTVIKRTQLTAYRKLLTFEKIAMLAMVVLFLLFRYTLFYMLSEKNDIYYRDVRFWLVIASLCMLVWLTLHSYG